jgi:hypothetical protein
MPLVIRRSIGKDEAVFTRKVNTPKATVIANSTRRKSKALYLRTGAGAVAACAALWVSSLIFSTGFLIGLSTGFLPF